MTGQPHKREAGTTAAHPKATQHRAESAATVTWPGTYTQHRTAVPQATDNVKNTARATGLAHHPRLQYNTPRNHKRGAGYQHGKHKQEHGR